MGSIMSTIMSTHYDPIMVVTIPILMGMVYPLYGSRDMAIPNTMVLGSIWCS